MARKWSVFSLPSPPLPSPPLPSPPLPSPPLPSPPLPSPPLPSLPSPPLPSPPLRYPFPHVLYCTLGSLHVATYLADSIKAELSGILLLVITTWGWIAATQSYISYYQHKVRPSHSYEEMIIEIARAEAIKFDGSIIGLSQTSNVI